MLSSGDEDTFSLSSAKKPKTTTSGPPPTASDLEIRCPDNLTSIILKVTEQVKEVRALLNQLGAMNDSWTNDAKEAALLGKIEKTAERAAKVVNGLRGYQGADKTAGKEFYLQIRCLCGQRSFVADEISNESHPVSKYARAGATSVSLPAQKYSSRCSNCPQIAKRGRRRSFH